ncbi:DUF2187 family protein [Metabacillus litoralis]|nr:DUF2187 family protein [Metabacillus litoralis]
MYRAILGQSKWRGDGMDIAKIGDVISFKREDISHEGVVTGIRDNSVMVQYGRSKEKDEPLKTVVNHKNYKIISSS